MKRITLLLLASASISLKAMDQQHKQIVPMQSASQAPSDDAGCRECAKNVAICACLPLKCSGNLILDVLCCPIDCCVRLGGEPTYPDICLPRTQKGLKELADCMQ
jgi:hypothetical protein